MDIKSRTLSIIKQAASHESIALDRFQFHGSSEKEVNTTVLNNFWG